MANRFYISFVGYKKCKVFWRQRNKIRFLRSPPGVNSLAYYTYMYNELTVTVLILKNLG